MDVDIFKHELVPRHKLLSEEEKKKVLEKYNVKLHDLPKIKLKDPVVIALKEAGVNINVWDLIEIERKSQTAGKTKFYRVVVSE